MKFATDTYEETYLPAGTFLWKHRDAHHTIFRRWDDLDCCVDIYQENIEYTSAQNSQKWVQDRHVIRPTIIIFNLEWHRFSQTNLITNDGISHTHGNIGSTPTIHMQPLCICHALHISRSKQTILDTRLNQIAERKWDYNDRTSTARRLTIFPRVHEWHTTGSLQSDGLLETGNQKLRPQWEKLDPLKRV